MLNYVAVEERPGRPVLSAGVAVLAAEYHRVGHYASRACNAAAGGAGMSLLGVMTATQFSGGGDVQRNLLRILVVTSRSWGLMTTTPEARRVPPRAMPYQSTPVRMATKVSHVAHHGLRWAW